MVIEPAVGRCIDKPLCFAAAGWLLSCVCLPLSLQIPWTGISWTRWLQVLAWHPQPAAEVWDMHFVYQNFTLRAARIITPPEGG